MAFYSRAINSTSRELLELKNAAADSILLPIGRRDMWPLAWPSWCNTKKSNFTESSSLFNPPCLSCSRDTEGTGRDNWPLLQQRQHQKLFVCWSSAVLTRLHLSVSQSTRPSLVRLLVSICLSTEHVYAAPDIWISNEMLPQESFARRLRQKWYLFEAVMANYPVIHFTLSLTKLFANFC